ncbi:hypothetical protein Tco_0627446 [Tanacetum coccineum]|uniref:Uncharacterized protein n=1 Tax=Tanacetum coccineum TaxID=301880 RepID=A0ABQ4WMG1_9ASTR
MGQLNELLIKSLTAEFSKIVSAHDFSSSLPTELKDLPSKFNELTDEVKALKTQVHGLKIKVRGDLKELLTKLEEFTMTVTTTSQVGDQCVPSAGQASTMPAEGEKNTNKATISQLFQRRTKKNVERTNLNKPQPETTTPPPIPPEQTKIDMGKKAMSSKDAKEENGEHVHLTKEQGNQQKKIEEEAKAEAASHEGEIRKKELIDLLGPEVVNNDLHLGEWREVVIACLNKKGKGWTSIYKQIQERIDYLRTTEAELGIDLDRPLSKQDPLDRLNDLANKKRKHADDIHDFFRANKRLKSHQSPRLDDHARTFSFLLLAEVDKRNLNLLKQMRVIEQLRR